MSAPLPPDMRVVDDAGALYAAAASHFVDCAAAAIQRSGRFVVALSGGATPNGVYTLLATKAYRARVPWAHVHVFWGDERCVPPDDPRSNYRAAFELLLSHVPIPPSQVHRLQGELPPHDAAAAYETLLRTTFDTPRGAPRYAPRARFDLVLLGLGTDGHTASLFPQHAAPAERDRWCVSEYVASAGMWRLTLTPPVLDAAADVLFLVSGEEKRAILRTIVAQRSAGGAPRAATRLPAAMIQPLDGRIGWLVDAAAAPLG